MKKVLITPRSYGKHNRDELIKKLNDNGIEAIFNPYGNIMSEEQMIKEIKDIDGVILGVDPMNANVLSNANKLKVISKYGVGIDNIDCDYANKNGIIINRTVGANSSAVADYAMTLLCAVARRLVEIDNGCHNDDWGKREALDIFGKKIGVIGLGAIGKGVVKRAKGFDMEVYGFDIFKDSEYIEKNNIKFTNIDTIVKECDFISLHLPLTNETKHILNENNLKFAKDSLIIINTARGGLVDEEILYNLLVENKIYGVGLDVFEQEPPKESKLLTLPNVIVGSHTAASTKDATIMMSEMATDNIIAELNKF